MKFLIPRMHPIDVHLAHAVQERGDDLYIIGSFRDAQGFLEKNALTWATYYHIDSHRASGLDIDTYLSLYLDMLTRVVGEQGIDCILPSAATDMILRAVGLVNDKFGLPGIGFDAANIFGDKSFYTHVLANSLNVPWTHTWVEPGKTITETEFDYPVICKPTVGSGSKGIYVAQNAEQLEWFFGPSDRPQDFSPAATLTHERLDDGSLRNYLYHGEGSNYMVSEFIEGDCISISGTMEDYGLRIDCVHEVQVTPLPYRSETGYRFFPQPSELDVWTHNLAGKLGNALPFPLGAWRADCIWTGSMLWVVDVAPRMCTTASQALAYSTPSATHYAHAVITSIMTGTRAMSVQPTKAVSCQVLDLPKGNVVSVNAPEIEGVVFEEPDPVIFEPRNDYQSWARGWVLAVGDTIEEADGKVKQFKDDLHVEMQP